MNEPQITELIRVGPLNLPTWLPLSADAHVNLSLLPSHAIYGAGSVTARTFRRMAAIHR
jgi:hypothetical protein